MSFCWRGCFWICFVVFWFRECVCCASRCMSCYVCSALCCISWCFVFCFVFVLFFQCCCAHCFIGVLLFIVVHFLSLCLPQACSQKQAWDLAGVGKAGFCTILQDLAGFGGIWGSLKSVSHVLLSCKLFFVSYCFFLTRGPLRFDERGAPWDLSKNTEERGNSTPHALNPWTYFQESWGF